MNTHLSLMWTNAISNVVICMSYWACALMIHLISRRVETQFKLTWRFAVVFIGFCGLGRFFHAAIAFSTIFTWLAPIEDAMTAMLSLGFVFIFVYQAPAFVGYIQSHIKDADKITADYEDIHTIINLSEEVRRTTSERARETLNQSRRAIV